MQRNLIFLLGSILLLVSCKDKKPGDPSITTTIKLDSSLGIGNHIQFFNLPGGIVAVNPDSGNRVIFVAADGKTTRTIYRDIDPASRLQVLNKVAVDSSAMEIYIYSPRERRILVYDTAGNYKGNIAIQRVHDGSFTRIHGKFLFLDKTDSTKKDAARVYVVDSTGGEVNGL